MMRSQNTPASALCAQRSLLWHFSRAVLLLSVVLLGGLSPRLSAQSTNIAEASDSLTGFWIKKVVSNTQIPSGVTFSYTIYFSFPAGTQNVTITDVLPPAVVFQSFSVTSACPPSSTSLPTAGTTGTVQVSWGALPNGCSGSMTIVVSFPNGITCNGAAARNRVCLAGSVLINGQQIFREFCTPYVSTTAQAASTWSIQKQLLGSTSVGGNCSRALPGDTATYLVCLTNNPGQWGWNGQLNLVNGTVTDVLPSGAQFISASCPVSVSGQTITWNVGNLSATQPYNTQCCTLKVYYPPSTFPANSQITNTVTLSGQTGSPQAPCGSIQQPNTLCWQKVAPPPPTTTAQLWKWVSTNGQPGCGGTYTIQLCNTGQTTISSATITDTLPNGVSFTSFGYTHPGLTVSQSGGVITATLNSALQPGQCRWFSVNFTVSPTATPNSTITNCAWAQIPGLQPLQSCASFVVQAPAPSACIGKEICSPQASYSPGQIVRVRFRLQNIGGQSITGATLVDNLHPSLQYVGNPSFYSSNAWNTPCNPTSGTSSWTPAPTLSVSGQTITVSNITIPATCQNLFWNGCGYYGNAGVPFYWIEFDAKITDTAALGNIPNNYTLSGGGLPQPVTSNTVYLLVTGTTGFTLEKKVASDTTNWQNSLTASAGSTVNYRLRMNLTGTAPLRYATFVDLLPMDNGSSDGKILQACASRGSQYSLTYQSTVASTPASTGYSNPATTLASANAISSAIGAPPLFPTSCGTAGSWSSGIAAGSKNLGVVFGTVGAGSQPTVVLAAKLDAQAQPGQIACNTFAAGGAVRHLLNSSTIQDVPIGALESAPACVTVDSTSRCYRVSPQGTPPTPIGVVSTPKGDACKYQWTVSVTNPGPATQGCVSSPQGQVTPSSFTLPTGTSTLTLTFVDIPPQDQVACFYFGTLDAAGVCTPCDTLCVDLPPCPKPDTCCPRFERVDIKCKGRDSSGNQVYQLCASGTLPCKASIVLTSPDGSFTPAAFWAGPGVFTICTDFTDLPPTSSGAITIHYAVIGQGVVLCRDSARLQLPQCPPAPRNCCDLWQRTLQTQVKWFSNGTAVITGTATATAPISAFKAAIVNAQLKRWCPVVPPPPSSWQRIYGDITGGWLSPAPGAGVTLTPFSRQISWEGPVPDSCKRWFPTASPASFQLNMLFPAASGLKCGDSLCFTVRYTFTDCECRTCDTLITYCVARKKKFPDFPWFTPSITRPSPNRLHLAYNDAIVVESEASDEYAQLQMLEFRVRDKIRPRGIELKDIRVVDDQGEEASGVQTRITEGGGVVIFGERSKTAYELRITMEEGVPDTGLSIIATWTWEETDAAGETATVSETRSLTIPDRDIYDAVRPIGTIVQDRESLPPHVRTFALAFVNGPVPANRLEIELTPLPQPDGTVPQIIAIGPVDAPQITIKCTSCCPVRCQHGIEGPVEPGEMIRPLFMTVAGSKRDGLDAVELEYVLRDGETGTAIGKGRVILEGAVSGIKPGEEEASLVRGIEIGSVIPNPASEVVTVALQASVPTRDVTLELVDTFGRPVATVLTHAELVPGTTAVPVNVGSLPNGTYLLVLRSSAGTAAKKLVVVR
ncbi:MAG: hypothetical protein KatS3mg038_1343 [Candidatus Kapaibacterium sp.]|nr:MAG: hypothetical protein KatS3mg038_1343 [Candidatus Kapabacteria bacterium]